MNLQLRLKMAIWLGIYDKLKLLKLICQKILLYRAVDYLESAPLSDETEAMWKTLLKISQEKQQLHIAERYFVKYFH